MKYALNISENGRILSATFEEFAAEDMVLVDVLPEGDVSDYLYRDDEYVYDPLPEPETPEEPADLETRVATVETDLADLTAAVEKGLSL